MDLLIVSAVEPSLARGVEPAVPVITLPENLDVIGTVIIVEKAANTIPAHLPNQQLAPGAAAPPSPVDQVNIILPTAAAEIGWCNPRIGEHVLLEFGDEPPIAGVKELTEATDLISVECLLELELLCASAVSHESH
jgi:hypothetical protein